MAAEESEYQRRRGGSGIAGSPAAKTTTGAPRVLLRSSPEASRSSTTAKTWAPPETRTVRSSTAAPTSPAATVTSCEVARVVPSASVTRTVTRASCDSWLIASPSTSSSWPATRYWGLVTYAVRFFSCGSCPRNAAAWWASRSARVVPQSVVGCTLVCSTASFQVTAVSQAAPESRARSSWVRHSWVPRAST